MSETKKAWERKQEEAVSRRRSAWRRQKQKLALHKACVGVNSPSECAPDAWKVLFLEQVVNCRRISELRSCMKMRTCGSTNLRSYGSVDLRSCGSADLRTCVWAKNSKFYKVSKLKFWHLGFFHLHPKAMFGCLPLNFSIISMILVASGRSKA